LQARSHKALIERRLWSAAGVGGDAVAAAHRSEAYDQTNGWALPGEVDPDHAAQDARDAATLFRTLEQEVVPAFYDRDPDGLPHSWLDRIRASMRTLAPAFCAGRMLEDYLQRIYAPTETSA
jgi:starch phosphorylase